MGNPSGSAPPVSNLAGWTLIHTEDFNGSAGSTLPPNWLSYGPSADSAYSTAYFLPSHTTLDGNGNLVISGYADSAAASCAYPTGGVQFYGAAQQFGKYVLRAKIDVCDIMKIAAGLWPSSNTFNAEIDFWEDGGGSRTAVQSHLHEYSTATPYPNATLERDWSYTGTGWNEIGVEWSPHGVYVILNGAVVGNFGTTGLPTETMNLFVQLECLASAVTGSTPSSASLFIDWAAFYAYNSASYSSAGQGGASVGISAGSSSGSSGSFQQIKVVRTNVGNYSPAPSDTGTVTVAWDNLAPHSATNTAGNDVTVYFASTAASGQTFTVTPPAGWVSIASEAVTNTGFVQAFRLSGAPAATSWPFAVSSSGVPDIGWVLVERSGVDPAVAASAASPFAVASDSTSQPVTGIAPTGTAASSGTVYCVATMESLSNGPGQATAMGISPSSWVQEGANTAVGTTGSYVYVWSQPASSSAPSATLQPSIANTVSGFFYALTPAALTSPSQPNAPVASLGSDSRSIVVTWGTLPGGVTGVNVLDQSGSLVAANQTGTSSAIAGLSPGSTHTYAVQFVGAGGPSPTSPQSNAVTLPTVPAQPSQPSAQLAANQISVLVDVSNGSGSLPAGITGYNLFRSVNGGSFTALAGASGLTTVPYTDTAVAAGSSYAYQTTFANALGTSSASPSSTAVAVPTGSSGSPSGTSGGTSQLDDVASSVASEFASLKAGVSASAPWGPVATAFQALASALQTLSSTGAGINSAIATAQQALATLGVPSDSTFAPLQQLLTALNNDAPTFAAAAQAASSFAGTASTCASVATGLASYSTDLQSAEGPAQSILTGLSTLSAGQEP